MDAGADTLQKALQVNLSGVQAGGQVRWIAFNPYGVPVESTSSLVCYTNFSDPSCNSTSRSYANPLPGIWEMEIEPLISYCPLPAEDV